MIKKHLLSILLLSTSWIMPQDYTIKLVTGNEIDAIIPIVLQQWVDENAHYPYLFKGTLANGYHYFQKIITSPQAAFVVAFDRENNMVGFLSGAPLADFASHDPALEDYLKRVSFDSKSFYYFSDIIILSEHRKVGLGKKFFELLEQHALSLGYTESCLICESHPDGHPLKPKDYYELDNIWKKFGYQTTDIIIPIPWDTFQVDGTVQFQEHIMSCWVKNLTA